jgi:hypothetical protein
LAVQRLMSSSMVILITCSCVDYDLCRFLVGHYRGTPEPLRQRFAQQALGEIPLRRG